MSTLPSSLSREDALRIVGEMSAGCGWPGIYFLNCGLERRVNVLSQQIRGISLVSALLASGTLTRKHRVAIIGGGVAGVSAACRAVHGGCEVTVLESGSEALHRLQTSPRYLHPRLYEWPRENFRNDHSDLSILNWYADTADRITACLAKQWNLWLRCYAPDNGKQTGHLHWKPETACKALKFPDGKPRLSWVEKSSGQEGDGEYDCVLLAVGFGGEPDSLDISEAGIGGEGQSYWQRSIHKISGAREHWTLAVSGNGDSALRDVLNDVLRYDLLELTGNSQLLAVLVEALESVRPQAWPLLAVEENYVHQAKDNEAKAGNLSIIRQVEALFQGLPLPAKVPLELPPDVESVRILMQGRSDASALSPVSFPLNRYLLASMQKAGKVDVEYVQDERTGTRPAPAQCVQREDDRYRLLFPSSTWPGAGQHPLVDRAYYRYGAERMLQNGFPDLFEHLKKVKDPRLDTGEHLYRPVFQPDGAGRKRIFYSDLYDSVIQRELEAAFNKHGIGDLFVPLYAGRLRLELLMRDAILLTDAQVLDGRFFIRRWAIESGTATIALGMDELRRHAEAGRIRLKFRPGGMHPTPSGAAVWGALEPMLLAVKDGAVSSKKFLLSGLGSAGRKDLRQRIQETSSDSVSKGSAEGNVRDYMRRVAKSAQRSKFLRQAPAEQLAHWERCAAAHFSCEHWNGDFYLPGSFEDPAGFLMGLDSTVGEDFAFRAFAELQRSKIDEEWWAMRRHRKQAVRRDAVKIYEWYNRAYHRTIARQHGATVIETTFVQRFPKYMHPHLARWREQPPASHDSPLTPAHLMALGTMPEEEFLALLDTHARFSSPTGIIPVLEAAPAWSAGAREFQRRCAALQGMDLENVEPEFRLLCGAVRTVWQPLDEYRIFDSISPAGVHVNCLGTLADAEGKSCSLVEYLEPL